MGKIHFYPKILMKKTVLFLKIKKSQFCHPKSSSVNQKPVLSTEFFTCRLLFSQKNEKDSSVLLKVSSVHHILATTNNPE